MGSRAPDFGTFLEQYVSDLESGDYDVRASQLKTRAAMGSWPLTLPSRLDQPSARKLTRSGCEYRRVRSGRARGDRCDLAITGGDVQLRGSLSGAKFNKVLRVTVRVGKPRGFGFLAPIHDIVEWEAICTEPAALGPACPQTVMTISTFDFGFRDSG